MINLFEIEFNEKHNEAFVSASIEYENFDLLSGHFKPEIMEFHKDQGRNFYDIVRLQDVFNFLISEKLLNLLIDNNVSGWDTYPAIIDGKNGYNGFQIIGNRVKLNMPTKTGWVKGYDLDMTNYDGSDFFLAENTGVKFCSEKAKNILDSLKIKNIEITPTEVVEWYNP